MKNDLKNSLYFILKLKGYISIRLIYLSFVLRLICFKLNANLIGSK